MTPQTIDRDVVVARINQRLSDLKTTAYVAAKDAGLGRFFIFDYLRGRTQGTSVHTFRKIAQALSCSYDYITGVSDEIGEPEQSMPARPLDPVESVTLTHASGKTTTFFPKS